MRKKNDGPVIVIPLGRRIPSDAMKLDESAIARMTQIRSAMTHPDPDSKPKTRKSQTHKPKSRA